MAQEKIIETAYYQSPFGVFEIKGSEEGIQSVQLKPDLKDPGVPAPPVLAACVRQLNEYFSRERDTFDLKLDLSDGSEFFQSVWAELLKIPYGHTTTYSALAEKIGDLKAVRNPIAIIVPCHRCIAKSGDLQGYFYGLDMKRKLVELENPMSFAEQGSLF